jgi:hypothetical protein
VVLGAGKCLIQDGMQKRILKRGAALPFATGIFVMIYKPVGKEEEHG